MSPSGKLNRFAQQLRVQRNEAIAVVGMACRFPGAPNIEAFLRLLETGSSGISEVPRDRWDIDAYYSAERGAPGKMCTRLGGFVEDVRSFAADFFDISPSEASGLDPQQSMLLEVTWEAIESAAINLKRLARSSTAVFVGISAFDSAFLQGNLDDGYGLTGVAHSAAAGRLSYFFDLTGAAECIDTACSSALVAVHRACQSLRAGECSAALAGGVNAMLSPLPSIAFSRVGMLAPDGQCKTFDEGADGYVRSEGCGMVFLKRLSDARRDDNRILAVIRSSATNQDGRTQGLTAPNGLAQQAVVRQALVQGGLEPEDIQYIEAHGTGTPLGDPQELHALSAVFKGRVAADQRVLVGSAKANIGHLEAAAGIAGLIKLILSVEHDEIFPHINLKRTNPEIPLTDLPLQISTTLRPWPRRDRPRIGGVSSFGFTGTNAHVVVEQAPPVETSEAAFPEAGSGLFLLSARTAAELSRFVDSARQFLLATPGVSLTDVCRTAAERPLHAHRLAVQVTSTADLRSQLDAFHSSKGPSSVRTATVRSGRAQPKVAFLFADCGARYAGMGHRLYQTQPVFRRALDTCIEILRPLRRSEGGPFLLDETDPAEPALFALEWALAELWRSLGLEPAAVFGHGVGEYAAACIAGVFSLEDGLRLMVDRASPVHHQIPALRFVSSITGEPFQAAPDAAYWRKQPCAPNRLDLGLKSLVTLGCEIFLEIGPEPVLTGLAESFVKGSTTWLASLKRGTEDSRQIQESAAELVLRGRDLDLAPLERGKRIAFPSYPFERRQHAPLPPANAAHRPPPPIGKHALLGQRLASPLEPIQFESELTGTTSYLADHRLFGVAIFPASGYVELILAIARETLGKGELRVEDVTFLRPLPLPAEARRIQTVLQRIDRDHAKVEIFAQEAGFHSAWQIHARAQVSVGDERDPNRAPAPPRQPPRFDSEKAVAVADIYRTLSSRGLDYGPNFRGLSTAWRGPEGEAVGQVVLPKALGYQAEAYVIHPVLLDSALHLLAATDAALDPKRADDGVRVPKRIAKVVVHESPGDRVWVRARTQGAESELRLFDDSGNTLVEIRGLELEPVAKPLAAAPPDAPQRDAAAPTGEVFADRLRAAPVAERRELMLDFIQGTIRQVMGIASDEALDLRASMFEIGMTSLKATELQYWLQKKLLFKLPARASIDLDSAESLADALLKLVLEPPSQKSSAKGKR